MINLKYWRLIAASASVIVCNVSCREEPPENPCATIKPINADFQVYEIIGPDKKAFPIQDTLVASNNYILLDTYYADYTFQALSSDADKYQFVYKCNPKSIDDNQYLFDLGTVGNKADSKVVCGTDDLKDPKKTSLVRLRASRNNPKCTANPVLKDSVSKMYEVVPLYQAPILGSYKGKIQGTDQELTVKIDTFKMPRRLWDIEFRIHGLWGDTNLRSIMEAHQLAYNMYFIVRDDPDPNDGDMRHFKLTEGYANYNGKKNELTIEYSDGDVLYKGEKKKRFVGKKIY